MDKFKDECGIFGVHNHSDAAALTVLGLHALQHRGQEAAGIISRDVDQFYQEKTLGLVGKGFSKKDVINRLKGNFAIGHTRYSTTGSSTTKNIQPIFADLSFGSISICHNGNITNALTLRNDLINKGSIFHTTSDTETVIHLIAKSEKHQFIDKLIDAISQITGAYSLVIMTDKLMVGARDPFGVRPLVIGKLENGAKVFSSETVALDMIGANLLREVNPGEIVIFENNNIKSINPFEKKEKKFCIFEFIYFSRPDSTHENKNVYEIRKLIGKQLAKEFPVKADYVCPIPDSGNAAAMGYSEFSKIPYEMGVVRNHYVGRTFIEPTNKIRNLGVKLKHNINKKVLKNKKIILVDDSIVRGTTSKKIVEMLKESGVKEIHFRIASPPIINSCFYGVDTPNKKELIASYKKNEEIKKYLNCDTLEFLSIEGLYSAVNNNEKNNLGYCDACFTNNYPIELVDIKNKNIKNSQLSFLEE